MPKAINRAIHLPSLLGFAYQYFAPPQIWSYRQFSFLPNSRNEEMMVMVSFGATAAGLF